jgi:hypothetical protein
VAEPERRLGRLHGLVDHPQQLALQGVQVDLVAQPGREGVQGAGGVVAAAVEAAVDQVLDSAAQRRERRRGGQGGGGTARLPDPSASLGVAATMARYGSTSRPVTTA